MKNCDLCIKNDVCKIKQKGIKSCDRYSTILASPKLEQIDIVALTQELNNLLANYNAIYSSYERMRFINEELTPTKAQLHAVLEDLEKAIKGLCYRIAKREIIIHGNSEIKE